MTTGRTINPGLVVVGLGLCMGLVGFAYVTGQAVVRSVPSNQIVKVRGVAEKVIQSDRVNWKISVTSVEKELATAYRKTDEGVVAVKNYLISNKIPEDVISISGYQQQERTRTITLDKFHNTETKFIGHEVTQWVEIKDFQDLDLVENLAKNFVGQVQRLVPIARARSPYFFFSQPVEDIKPTLLKESAENAYQRAMTIAESSGSSLGGLKAARQGIFDGFGSDGYVGGSAREHRVTAVVTVDYAVRM